MVEISANLINSLKTLGLSDYEAKVYSALTLFNNADPKKLIEYLGISKPSVYESLRSLENRGLVVLVNTKPSVYKAIPSKMAMEILMDVHKNAANEANQELINLEKEKIDEKTSEPLWMLYGKNNIDYKIKNLLKNVSHEIDGIMSDKYLHYIMPLAGKGLKLRLLIISEDKKLQEKLEKTFKNDEIKLIVLSKSFFMQECEQIGQYARELIYSLDIDNVFITVFDSSEFIYIPPVNENELKGLNTTNQALIIWTKISNELWWNSLDTYLNSNNV